MKGFRNYVYTLYLNIINSIAFYPAIISAAFLLFSFLVMWLEYRPFVIDFKSDIAIVLVSGEDNARLILGTLVGSIISLMVFSFSMVMLVLGRASTTLSPRVIPGLITQKAHQIVLGVYLGTIIYSLILIINIKSPQAQHQVPSLGVLFAMIFGIYCLALFVYFIHSISKSIQADNILDNIFNETSSQLDHHDDNSDSKIPDIEGWISIKADQSGYLKQVNVSQLMKICEEHKVKVAITEYIGFFIIEGYPFIKVNKEITDEQQEDILQCFINYPEEHVNDHYHFGFKQISEIAVKALSPGINDPGTAIKALDMLSILFIKRMKNSDSLGMTSESGDAAIYFQELTFEELLYMNLTPIREYGKQDAIVMFNLLKSLKNIIYADTEKCYTSSLVKYITSVVSSCENEIENTLDRKQLNKVIESINELVEGEKSVPLLD